MRLSRRDTLKILALSSAAAATGTWTARADAPPPPTTPVLFTLPPLPYAYDALEPHLDAQTMTIHHTKHHQAYVDNLNKALAIHPDLAAHPLDDLLRNLNDLPESVHTAVRNHGGGHANHALFWSSLSPSGGTPPTGPLGEAITTTFQSFDAMREQLLQAGKSLFGSGWTWLCLDTRGNLMITTTPNQDSPLTRDLLPLVGLDVWEHAYYLKYQNRRADYLDAVARVIDWTTVEARYIEAVAD